MPTTNEYLISLANTKAAIKKALEAQGIDMTDVAFNEFASKILGGIDPLDNGVYIIDNNNESSRIYKLADDADARIEYHQHLYWNGDRSPLIRVVKTIGKSSSVEYLAGLVSNSMNAFYWSAGQSSAELKFTFNEEIIIYQVRILMSSVADNGTWQLSGSNDDITYTNVGEPILLNSTINNLYISDNTSAYKYYKFAIVSGVTNGGPYWQNFRFRTNKKNNYREIYEPSWFNFYSTGYRIGEVELSITGGYGGNLSNLLSHVLNNSFWWNNGQSSAKLKFTFNEEIIIAGIYLGQNYAANNGTWQLSGSNDDITYTNVGDTLTINSNINVIEFPNTSAYKYYKFAIVSGVTNSGPYWQKMIFKTAIPST